ncbi:MAG TPA: NAD(P)/FAD-dependent oxidoreductase [Dehalococcoidia bacterium]|nr:NAD(P)/FAD-dependent oxidoreductase [Dehalococcoidia bacterium]
MIVVIGAGVVGLAVAMELAARDQVIVLERNHAIGLETSSHNSGVIHSGIYYPTGSLKHRLCLEGNRLLYEWAQSHSVRTKRTGKIMVATAEDEIEALEGVLRQAQANEVPGVRRLSVAEACELEPSLRCVAALFSETSGVVDQAGLMRSLASELQSRGGIVALNHEVVAAERRGAGFSLAVRDADGTGSKFECDLLVNSAGLAADRVAAMLGYDLDGTETTPRLRQGLNKGRYYDIVTPEKARGLRHLIYPVPQHRQGGLGVHLTLDIDGGAHLGPDTEWLPDGCALDYRADDLRRDAFLEAARRFLPSLERDDIAPGQVGYRPKLQRPGEDMADFLIWHDRGYVHLGGIESPGLTSSLAIARHVAGLL